MIVPSSIIEVFPVPYIPIRKLLTLRVIFVINRLECVIKSKNKIRKEPTRTSTMELLAKIVNDFDWVLNTPLCCSKLFCRLRKSQRRFREQQEKASSLLPPFNLWCFIFTTLIACCFATCFLHFYVTEICIQNNKNLCLLTKTGNAQGTPKYFARRSAITVCGICAVIMGIYIYCVWSCFDYLFIEHTDITYYKNITIKQYACITWSTQIAWIIYFIRFSLCFSEIGNSK